MSTLSQTEKPYYFEPTFEDQVVWACLTSPVFFSRLGRELNPDLFSQPHAKLLVRAAHLVAATTKQGPANAGIALQRLSNLSNVSGKLSLADLSAAKAWVDEYEATKPVINVEAIIGEIAPILAPRMKHEAVRMLCDRVGTGGDTSKVAELLAKAENIGKAGAERLAVTRLSAETAEKDPVEWIWQGRIARGTFQLIYAAGGMGKSTLLRDIAVRMMMGTAMPGEDEGREPANVLMIGPEDNEATIANRLAGAGLQGQGWDRFEVAYDELKLPSDVAKLRERIVAHNAALVIIELHHLDKGSDGVADDVRRGVDPLQALAKETGAAILLVRHTTKIQTGSARQVSNGSAAWQSAARHVLMLAPNPEDADARVLAVSKTNLGTKSAAIGIREDPTILDNGKASLRLTWDTTVQDWSADELVAAQQARQNAAAKGGSARDTQFDAFKATVQTFLRDGAVKTKPEITAVLEKVGLGNVSKLNRWLPQVAETFQAKGAWRWRLKDAPAGLTLAA